MKYEVTVTLKPLMYQWTAKEQYRMTKEKIYEIFQDKIPSTVVAELTKDHNIHYHCMVNLDTIEEKDKFLNKFRRYKEFGKKSCSQVKFEDSYKEYMKKDIETTKRIIGDPIVTDGFGITKMLFTGS